MGAKNKSFKPHETKIYSTQKKKYHIQIFVRSFSITRSDYDFQQFVFLINYHQSKRTTNMRVFLFDLLVQRNE
jgi:hypothetical protein